MKDGTWTYYDDDGKIIKTEDYDRGYLRHSSNAEVATEEPMKKIVPKEVLEYQKKNSHKKHVKVVDGSTSY